MPAIDRNEFRRRFWTAQLIAGGYAAIQGAHAGLDDGGLLWAVAGGTLGFLFVVPLAAGIVWFMLRTGLGTGPAPARTRWLGAVVTGLAICAVIVGGSLLLAD